MVELLIVFSSRRFGAGVRVERAFLIVATGTLSIRLIETAATRFSRLLVPKRLVLKSRLLFWCWMVNEQPFGESECLVTKKEVSLSLNE